MTRRQYGSGSVYQLANGRWQGAISGVGYTASGTRRRVTVSAKTKADAQRKLREKQRQIATDGIPEAGVGRATVKAWADVWLPRHQNDVRPRVFVNDRGNITRWVIPTIGHKRLEQLTPADVRAVKTAISKAGRSSTTARNVHWTLMGMLKAARIEGHQVPARVTEVKAPVPAVSDRDVIPIDDAVKVLAVALQLPDRARWVASMVQGMRQGEVLGLTWDCVDFTRGVIDVSWQLQALPYTDPKNRAAGFTYPDGYEYRHLTRAWHLVRPKTARGRRTIPLGQWMHTELSAWRSVAPVNPWGLVWSEPDKHGNPLPVKVKDDRDRWKALQVAAGVQHPNSRLFQGHEARHNVISWMEQDGVPQGTIEQIVGHSQLVRSYVHPADEQSRKAIDAIAARLQLDGLPGVVDPPLSLPAL